MKLNRRKMIAASSAALVPAVAGCFGSGDSEPTDDENETDNGTDGETDAGDDTDNNSDNGDESQPGDDGESPPADILDAHTQALETAGSFSVEIEMQHDTYLGAEPEPETEAVYDAGLDYIYGTEEGRFESSRETESSGSLYGVYQTEDTQYTKSGWTGAVSETNSDFPVNVGTDVRYIEQGQGFDLTEHVDDFGRVGTTTYSGYSVTEYQLNEQDDYDEFEATLFVSDDNVVVYVEWDYVNTGSGGTEEVSGNMTVTDVGSASVTKPDWAPSNE